MFPAQISFSQEFMYNQVSLFWILLQKVHLFYLKRLKRVAYYLKQVVFISHFVHELQLNADFTPVVRKGDFEDVCLRNILSETVLKFQFWRFFFFFCVPKQILKKKFKKLKNYAKIMTKPGLPVKVWKA